MSFLLKFSADEERKKDQEKWNNFLKDIDNNLKKDKFSTVLQLVDKYLEDCKTPELHLQALMKKAQSCLGAWQQTSRWKRKKWIAFIICWRFWGPIRGVWVSRIPLILVVRIPIILPWWRHWAWYVLVLYKKITFSWGVSYFKYLFPRWSVVARLYCCCSGLIFWSIVN